MATSEHLDVPVELSSGLVADTVLDDSPSDGRPLPTTDAASEAAPAAASALVHVNRRPVLVGSERLEFYDLNPDEIDFTSLTALDLASAVRMGVVLVGDAGGVAPAAVADAANLTVFDDLRFRLAPKEVRFVFAEPDRIESALRRWTKLQARSAEMAAVDDLRSETVVERESTEAVDDGGKMAKLVASIFEQAASAGASDVHIEPKASEVAVRFRIDGVLQDHSSYPLSLATGLVSRVKVMAGMDISERRLPLDGRFRRRLADREFDARVVSLPTASGLEAAVVRLLDQSRTQRDLGDVGFHHAVSEPFLRMLAVPHGMILVTGPTGSGKTTTLYASLGQVSREDRRVFTVEDPVEIRFSGATQMQVNERAGLTFASALRSLLRADPDVILVGEIRDDETARLAAQAALTGHLVLSTLHTNDAAGAPTRLSDLGLEGYVVASALKGVLAQRLLRRLCQRCSTLVDTPEHVAALPFADAGLDVPGKVGEPNPRGCEHCRNGYDGRVVAAELLVVDDLVAGAIGNRSPSGEIERLSRAAGGRSMRDDALLWLSEGETTFEEIERVIA